MPPARAPSSKAVQEGEPQGGHAFSAQTNPRVNCGGATGWLYAASLQALHDNMLRQLALYEGAAQAEDALMMYYSNAFERNGASWALAEGTPDLVFQEAGAVRVRVQTRDPHAPNATARGHRDADSFERHAWGRVAAGAPLVLDETAYPLRALGAIRAKARCLECHQVAEDAVLGAYSYRFREIADD